MRFPPPELLDDLPDEAEEEEPLGREAGLWWWGPGAGGGTGVGGDTGAESGEKWLWFLEERRDIAMKAR